MTDLRTLRERRRSAFFSSVAGQRQQSRQHGAPWRVERGEVRYRHVEPVREVYRIQGIAEDLPKARGIDDPMPAVGALRGFSDAQIGVSAAEIGEHHAADVEASFGLGASQATRRTITGSAQLVACGAPAQMRIWRRDRNRGHPNFSKVGSAVGTAGPPLLLRRQVSEPLL
jgi:hypothetical protein